MNEAAQPSMAERIQAQVQAQVATMVGNLTLANMQNQITTQVLDEELHGMAGRFDGLATELQAFKDAPAKPNPGLLSLEELEAHINTRREEIGLPAYPFGIWKTQRAATFDARLDAADPRDPVGNDKACAQVADGGWRAA